MEITITDAAEKFIRRMIRFGGAGEDAGFRLMVTAGGCSGLSAEFTVEAKPADNDSVVQVNGIKLFLPAESRLLLDGVTIGFTDTPLATGLTFFDPKQKACACSSADTAMTTSSVDIANISRKH